MSYESLQADAVRVLRTWRTTVPVQDTLRRGYLDHLSTHPDAASRTCADGHLTASCVVFNPMDDAVALVMHKIVGRWLQPGGHLEESDETLVDAATREVREETGLEIDIDPVPVTLDCHPITCRGYTKPTRHFDIRFVARARGYDLTCSDESADLRWFNLEALPDTLDEVKALIAAGSKRLAAQGR